MDAKDLKSLQAEARKRMDAALEHSRRELAGVRTGRASVTILDPVHVEAYGSPMPLNQVASLSIPEPTTIVAQPFDPSLIGTIEKAIRAANLGLNPNNDGKVIRIPLPPLTEERRRDVTKVVRGDAENARVAVRNVRRDVLQDVKEAQKEKLISQDEEKKAQEEIQKLTDKHVAEIDQALAVKEKEIMQV